jgi:aspartyl-tRNA(Asn)/glutamyl-tRNA(Gln) amidotransferase subunit B
VEQYGLPEYDAEVLTESRELADYFEAVAEACGDAKQASNWVMGDVLRVLKEHDDDITGLPVTARYLATLIGQINNGTISRKIARTVFDEILSTGKDPVTVIKDKGLVQISDSDELTAQIREVLAANPGEVQKYLDGKEQVIGFLVGQVMRATRGQANPKVVNELLRKELAGQK